MRARHSKRLGTAELTVKGVDSPVNLHADLVSVHDDKGLLGDASTFSYIVSGEEGAFSSARPLVVVFNGGPGSSSTWLHLSGLAAFSLDVPEPGSQDLPYRPQLQESKASLLQDADLLFIDPVGAGFGRRQEDVDPARIHGTMTDVQSFAAIIHAWLRRENRLGCPVFIVGESYGTMRAAVLADTLQTRFEPIGVHGVALLGQALNVMDTAQRPGNPLGYIANLELLAAAGWFHGRVKAPSLTEAVNAAAEFARGSYAQALLTWPTVPEAERAAMADRLETLTGLSSAEWSRRRLRVTKEIFRRELLRDKGLTLGKYDARYTARSWDADRGDIDLDPDVAMFSSPFQAVLHQLFDEVLEVDTDRDYLSFDPSVAQGWNWFLDEGDKDRGPFGRFDHVGALTRWMRRQPGSRLLMGTGLYDTLTTVGAVDLLLATADLSMDRVLRRTYPAGHMMYTDAQSARDLTRDIRELVNGSD
jgi:carboxypeptidase C (cathepsin A)